jgi:hypothetical protein
MNSEYAEKNLHCVTRSAKFKETVLQKIHVKHYENALYFEKI